MYLIVVEYIISNFSKVGKKKLLSYIEFCKCEFVFTKIQSCAEYNISHQNIIVAITPNH